MERSIETKRLLLRPLLQSDAAQIAEKINHYEIAKNLARVPFPYHLSDAIEFLTWVKTTDIRSSFRAITLRDSPDDLLGIISVEWSESKSDSEIGYWLVQHHWGQGLMSEAVQAMVKHAFETGLVEKIVSCFFVENPASGKVLAKVGFEFTGQCTSPSKAQGQDVPVITVALTKSRWLELQV